VVTAYRPVTYEAMRLAPGTPVPVYTVPALALGLVISAQALRPTATGAPQPGMRDLETAPRG
jgi:hypothetical protein